jgi:hypothetical protein
MPTSGRGRLVRSFDYVNQPYDRVRDALRADPGGLFHDATRAAASRARSVAAALTANIAGIDVSTEIAIKVAKLEDVKRRSGPATQAIIEWKAARRPRLFPLMSAVLTIYPLTATETQLDFAGRYRPPLGALGRALNAVMGHRIAEASVHRFVADVAQHLRASLAPRGRGLAKGATAERATPAS